MIAYGNFIVSYGSFFFLPAGLTSSIGILQPVITFVVKSLIIPTKASLLVVHHTCSFTYVIFLPEFLDEFDFAGTIFLIILALVEIIIFIFIYHLKTCRRNK